MLGIAQISAQNNFPSSWVGHYQGNLEVYGVDSIAMKVKMEMEIRKTSNDSVYKWAITYHLKNKIDTRSYNLKIVDTKKGLFQIDENNSIVIDAYLKQNIFTSFFEVQNNVIIATYTKEEDIIIFEIISANLKPVSVTGNKTVNEKKIPEVTTFPITGRQRAVLYLTE